MRRGKAGRVHTSQYIDITVQYIERRGKKKILATCKTVFSDIHAREWISPAVLTYLATELLEESPEEEWTERFWDLDWYFVPSANPDGYVYTWEEDRLWRKTR